MTIGERLREERERMGMSQPKFAALAGTTKQTLFSWESGRTAPDGFQFAALDAAGADVRYIITGDRDGPAPEVLSADERLLLDRYRTSRKELQDAALRVLLGAEPVVKAKKQTNIHVGVNHGQTAEKIINKKP